MTFAPTEEQLACVSAYANTDNHLMIRARAGAAKTTTLRLMAEARETPTLCLAFNKSIATEMQTAMPPWVTAKTLSSLGYSIWQQRLGRRLKMNDKKMNNILQDEIAALRPVDQKIYSELFIDLRDTLTTMKTIGVLDTEEFPRATAIVSLDEFFGTFEIDWNTPAQNFLINCLNKSIRQAFQGQIDYADMLYLPAVFPCVFPKFPCIMVDEAQDLSRLNHTLLHKLLAANKQAPARLIVVGDDLQAIYGWRGADKASLDTLATQYPFTHLKLTTSFRCPGAVIREAQSHAADIRVWDKSDEGLVEFYPDWNPVTIPPDSVIICRNNAPLFSLAVHMLKEGRYAKLIGNDMAASVRTIMKTLGKDTTSPELALRRLHTWEAQEKTRKRNHAVIRDKVACVKIFLSQSQDLGGAKEVLSRLMLASGNISLMTGHKAKGLEFPHVYFYLPELINREDDQEANLYYVIQTRALKSLHYVNDDFKEDQANAN